MMLTVQIMSGSVEIDRTKGSSQSMYHGYATGAHKSEAAIGHANVSDGQTSDLPLSHIATRRPTRTASTAASSGVSSRSIVANTGSLNRKRCTNAASEPNGMRPSLKKGI